MIAQNLLGRAGAGDLEGPLIEAWSGICIRSAPFPLPSIDDYIVPIDRTHKFIW